LPCETCKLLTELLLAGGMPERQAKLVGDKLKPLEKKAKRKASAYSIRYGKAFKKVAGKYKLKSGQWAKDGFKRAAAAARKIAKKGSTKKGQVRKTARRAYER